MVSESVLVAILGVLGGAGGVFTILRAWFDYRANHAARLDDVDERLTARLERLLGAAEQRERELERQHEEDSQHISQLTIALVRAGIDVPTRHARNT